MNQVNPPPLLRVPSEFQRNGETRSFVEQLQTIVFQLYNRTGGDIDNIDALIAAVELLIKNVNDLESVNASQVDPNKLKSSIDKLSRIVDDIDLQTVTDTGNETTNDVVLDNSSLIIKDPQGNQLGRISNAIQTGDFGLVIVAEDADTLRNRPATLAGSSVLLGTETLEAVFNGAEDGNFLRIVEKKRRIR